MRQWRQTGIAFLIVAASLASQAAAQLPSPKLSRVDPALLLARRPGPGLARAEGTAGGRPIRAAPPGRNHGISSVPSSRAMGAVSLLRAFLPLYAPGTPANFPTRAPVSHLRRLGRPRSRPTARNPDPPARAASRRRWCSTISRCRWTSGRRLPRWPAKIAVVKQQSYASFGTASRVPLGVPAPATAIAHLRQPPACRPPVRSAEPPSPQWGKPGPLMAPMDYEISQRFDLYPTPLFEKTPVSVGASFRNRDQSSARSARSSPMCWCPRRRRPVTVMDLSPLAAAGARILPRPAVQRGRC